MKAFIFIFFLLGALSAQARNWQKIAVPGALCGDGSPYSIFIDIREKDKLLIEFMGGGACWNEESCYGDRPLTNLHPVQKPVESVMNSTLGGNPWRNYSVLFFPYCTGDVHAGFHVASYKAGTLLYHNGFNNVALALQYLSQNRIVEFSSLRSATVWGSSAGAIGALIHANTVNSYLGSPTVRTLISDSPGLHFGKNFWRKFSDQMNSNFADSFALIGLQHSTDDGFLAPRMGPVFLHYGDWRIGILQSTKDYMMSLVFGGIIPAAHERLVLGPEGLPVIAKNYSNVSTWIPISTVHTFLVRNMSADNKDPQGETAWKFAQRILATAK